MERYYYITSRFGYLKATAKAYAPKWTRDECLAYAVKSWDAAAATEKVVQLVTAFPVSIQAISA